MRQRMQTRPKLQNSTKLSLQVKKGILAFAAMSVVLASSFLLKPTKIQSGHPFETTSEPLIQPEVVYSYFMASLQRDQSVQIDWATESEKDYAYFTVERGKDGSFFETLRVSPCFGGEKEFYPYVYRDTVPLSGKSYYRLRITDLNGHSVFTPVIEINRLKVSPNLSFVSASPNPFNGFFEVTYESGQEEDVVVSLYAPDGKKSYFKSFYSNSGLNTHKIIPPENLSSGLYTLIIHTSEGEHISTKIMYQP